MRPARTTYNLAQETTPPPTGGKVNPAKFCNALKATMGEEGARQKRPRQGHGKKK